MVYKARYTICSVQFKRLRPHLDGAKNMKLKSRRAMELRQLSIFCTVLNEAWWLTDDSKFWICGDLSNWILCAVFFIYFLQLLVGCVIEMISKHFHLNVTQMQQCNTYLCLRLCSFSQCTAFIGFILIMLCCYSKILCFVSKTIYLKKNVVYTFIHIDGLSYLRE